MKHEYIECECDSLHHILHFGWDEDPDWSEVFVTVYLNYYYGFWKRLWYGIKYILGFKSNYGQFEGAMLGNKKVTRLRDFCNKWLEKHPWPYGKDATPEENLKWAEKIVEIQKCNLSTAKKKLKEAKAAVAEEENA